MTHTIINREDGTHLNIGTKVRIISKWSVSGHALFTTDAGGMFWAHVSETSPIDA